MNFLQKTFLQKTPAIFLLINDIPSRRKSRSKPNYGFLYYLQQLF